MPLGFTPLDKTIGGGLRAGELLLIGGAQGTGKTTMAVQMARNIVMGGQASVLYVCYEHDEEYLLNRIIAMESALQHLPGRVNGVKLQDVRKEILSTWLAQGEGFADLMANPRLRPALERVNRYGPNLFMLRGSQTKNTVDNLHALVQRYKELSGDRRLVVFIDYMQKACRSSPTRCKRRRAARGRGARRSRTRWRAKMVVPMIAIGLRAVVASRPAARASMAGISIAAGLAGAGLALYQLGEKTSLYSLATAANATDFDKAQAISDKDPGLQQLALDCVMALRDVFAAAAPSRP